MLKIVLIPTLPAVRTLLLKIQPLVVPASIVRPRPDQVGLSNQMNSFIFKPLSRPSTVGSDCRNNTDENLCHIHR